MLWLVLAACADKGDTAAPEWLTLVDPAAWTLVPAEGDPFADKPDGAECLASGYSGLEGFFEVDTGVCAYGTFTQPLLQGVAAGEPLHLVYWHDTLWSEEPAQGHLAIQVGGSLLHEAYVDIPADAEIYPLDLEAPAALAEGDPVYFHVHNHGYNNWALGELEVFSTP